MPKVEKLERVTMESLNAALKEALGRDSAEPVTAMGLARVCDVLAPMLMRVTNAVADMQDAAHREEDPVGYATSLQTVTNDGSLYIVRVGDEFRGTIGWVYDLADFGERDYCWKAFPVIGPAKRVADMAAGRRYLTECHFAVRDQMEAEAARLEEALRGRA